MELQKGDKVGIIRCSNPQPTGNKEKFEKLYNCLKALGLEPIECSCIYDGSPQKRAHELMSFYKNSEIKAIFDISGGDMGNEILPHLDYDIIAKSNKYFWGYSDLTTVINAIYAKTGNYSMLYQIKNLIGWGIGDYDLAIAELQRERFEKFLKGNTKPLTCINYKMICKDDSGWKNSIVIGGNIRCFLKLAGTPYMPDMNGKLLLLEAYGGHEPQMRTYFSQLRQIGAFEQVSGIILGTFTTMEKNNEEKILEKLVLEITDGKIPIAKTYEIGHGINSKGIVIGKPLI